MTAEEVADLFPSLNAVLFTGGGAYFTTHPLHDGPLTSYAATGKVLLDLVLEANKQGDYVPLWGKKCCCALSAQTSHQRNPHLVVPLPIQPPAWASSSSTSLPGETPALLASNSWAGRCTCPQLQPNALSRHFVYSGMNATVLYDHFDAENYTVPLTLTSEAPTSVLLGTAPANVTPPPTQRVTAEPSLSANDAHQVMHTLTTQPVTMNNHMRGVPPGRFQDNANLASVLAPLSTNTDRNGLPFVSTVEGRNGLPMYN